VPLRTPVVERGHTYTAVYIVVEQVPEQTLPNLTVPAEGPVVLAGKAAARRPKLQGTRRDTSTRHAARQSSRRPS
jgi:hypothetical protein